MVRFSSGKTSVQLSVTDLEKPAGTVAESSRNANQHIQQCNGSQDVHLPEVYITNPEDGMCTRFLGENKDVPFLMAQAGSNIVDATAPEIRNARAARIQLYESLNGSKRQYCVIADEGYRKKSIEERLSKSIYTPCLVCLLTV